MHSHKCGPEGECYTEVRSKLPQFRAYAHSIRRIFVHLPRSQMIQGTFKWNNCGDIASITPVSNPHTMQGQDLFNENKEIQGKQHITDLNKQTSAGDIFTENNALP